MSELERSAHHPDAICEEPGAGEAGLPAPQRARSGNDGSLSGTVNALYRRGLESLPDAVAGVIKVALDNPRNSGLLKGTYGLSLGRVGCDAGIHPDLRVQTPEGETECAALVAMLSLPDGTLSGYMAQQLDPATGLLVDDGRAIHFCPELPPPTGAEAFRIGGASRLAVIFACISADVALKTYKATYGRVAAFGSWAALANMDVPPGSDIVVVVSTPTAIEKGGEKLQTYLNKIRERGHSCRIAALTQLPQLIKDKAFLEGPVVKTTMSLTGKAAAATVAPHEPETDAFPSDAQHSSGEEWDEPPLEVACEDESAPDHEFDHSPRGLGFTDPATTMEEGIPKTSSKLKDAQDGAAYVGVPEEVDQCIDFADVHPIEGEKIINFPVACLPTVIRDYVTNEAIATQTPVDYGGMLALGVLASVCQDKAEIQPKLRNPGYREPLALFVIVGVPSGSRKSSVFNDTVAPLRKLEAEAIKMEGSEIARVTARLSVVQQEIKAIKRRLANGEE